MDTEKLEVRIRLRGDEITKFQAIQKELGLMRRTEVIRALINKAYEQESLHYAQRIEHVNVFEDHAILQDNLLKRTVFVYTRNGKLSCDLCESTDCLHTRYAEHLRKKEQ